MIALAKMSELGIGRYLCQSRSWPDEFSRSGGSADAAGLKSATSLALHSPSATKKCLVVVDPGL